MLHTIIRMNNMNDNGVIWDGKLYAALQQVFEWSFFFFLEPSLLHHHTAFTIEVNRVLCTLCDENPDHKANLVMSSCKIRQNQFGALVSISFIVQGHLIIHDRRLKKV